MVESLKELNKICQKPRYKEVGNWMVRHILRDAALPITRLLLHTNVTANQVTLVSLIVGLWGIWLFSFQSVGLFLIGTLLLQLWYLLDHVDGQIARYRKTASLTGRFYDFLVHHIIHGVLFFSLGAYCFYAGGSGFFVFWGFVTSFLMLLFNLTHDIKFKTFYEKIISLESLSVRAADRTDKETVTSDNEVSAAKKIFSILHKLTEIHVLMNVLTLTAVLQVVFKAPLDFRFLLFLFYGITVPLIAVVKIYFILKDKKVDLEFEDQFETQERNVN